MMAEVLPALAPPEALLATPPAGLPGWIGVVGFLAVGLALAGAGGWWWAGRRRSGVGPATRARTELRSLAGSADDPRDVLEIARILRRFLQGLLGHVGGALTSEELAEALRARTGVDPGWAAEAVGVLRLCEERVFGAQAGPPANALAAAVHGLVDRAPGEARGTAAGAAGGPA